MLLRRSSGVDCSSHDVLWSIAAGLCWNGSHTADGYFDSGGRLMTDDRHIPVMAQQHDPDNRVAMGLPQQLLALLGDPRINPDTPAMVDIPDATVHMGLDRRSVDSVLERWAPYGLKRDWLLRECPRHEVHVRAFRIMRYPVTNYEYHRFLADTDYSSPPTSWQFGRYPNE